MSAHTAPDHHFQRYAGVDHDYRSFVGGRFVRTGSGSSDVMDPATGALIDSDLQQQYERRPRVQPRVEVWRDLCQRGNFEAMRGFRAGHRHPGISGADGRHGLYGFTEPHVVCIQGQ